MYRDVITMIGHVKGKRQINGCSGQEIKWILFADTFCPDFLAFSILTMFISWYLDSLFVHAQGLE